MGVVNGVQEFYPCLVQQGSGTILNTHSQAGLVPDWFLEHDPYTSAKCAVFGLSMSLRPEAAEHGVNVVVLIPSGTRSNILKPEHARPKATVTVGHPSIRKPVIRPNAPLIGPGPFVLDAEEVARITVAGLRADKHIIVTHKSA